MRLCPASVEIPITFHPAGGKRDRVARGWVRGQTFKSQTDLGEFQSAIWRYYNANTVIVENSWSYAMTSWSEPLAPATFTLKSYTGRTQVGVASGSYLNGGLSICIPNCPATTCPASPGGLAWWLMGYHLEISLRSSEERFFCTIQLLAFPCRGICEHRCAPDTLRGSWKGDYLLRLENVDVCKYFLAASPKTANWLRR